VLAMPSPGSQPITQPGVLSGDRPENYLTINPNAVAPLLTKVGVSTGIKPIGVLNGTYDGKPAPIPLDYHAQVNWGDSGQWFSADVVADVLNGFPLRILGSHTYTKAGVYSIVLNITGPDGQTIARATCSCTVLAH